MANGKRSETNKAAKCDLCAYAPYFSKKGGPAGSQACVMTCPMGALKVVVALPSQSDISGYDVNLAPLPKAPSAGAAPGAPFNNATANGYTSKKRIGRAKNDNTRIRRQYS